MGKNLFTILRTLLRGLGRQTLFVLAFAVGSTLTPVYAVYELTLMDPFYRDEDKGRSILMNAKEVHFETQYLTETERAQYAISFKGEGRKGRWTDAKGNLVDGAGIFVMDRDGNFYFKQMTAEQKSQYLGKFHHTSFFAARPVAGAGELSFFEGRLTSLNRDSGHYKPTSMIENQVLLELHRKGVDLEFVNSSYTGLLMAPGDRELSFSEVFTNYQKLREGSYEAAKEAVLALSQDARGRSLLRNEFGELFRIRHPDLQLRYARIIEDLYSPTGKLNFIDLGYATLNWDVSPETATQRLRKIVELQKKLPSNSTNLDCLFSSLDHAFSKSGERTGLMAALESPEFTELKTALSKKARPESRLARVVALPSRPSTPCLLNAVQKGIAKPGDVR